MPLKVQKLKEVSIIRRLRRVRVLPESVRPYGKSIIKWGLVGYIIRIAMMPLFAHDDLMLLARIGAILSQTHKLVLGGYPSTITWIFASVYTMFNPVLSNRVLSELTSNTFFLPQTLLTFYYKSLPGALTLNFVSKIPYLIFDFALAFLLLHMIDDGKKASLAFKLWMLNPISLLISYAIGQIDIMSAFFLVLALYFFKKRRELLSIVSLGICGIVKMFGMLFILPMALIYLKKRSGLKSKVKHLSLMLIVGFLPLVVDQITTLLTPTYYESANLAWPISDEVIGFFGRAFYSFGQQGNALLRGVFIRFLDFSTSFATYSFDKIYFTAFIYGLFLLGVVYLKDWSFERVWKAFLVFLLAYYAFALFHPQWFLLGLPLLVFAVAEDRDRYFKLYLLLVALYFVYVCYWNGLFTSTLAPILHQSYFWHGQIELLNNLDLQGYQVINIFRSILSAVFVVFAAFILRLDRLLRKSRAELP